MNMSQRSLAALLAGFTTNTAAASRPTWHAGSRRTGRGSTARERVEVIVDAARDLDVDHLSGLQAQVEDLRRVARDPEAFSALADALHALRSAEEGGS